MKKVQKKDNDSFVNNKVNNNTEGEISQLVSNTPLMLKKYNENKIAFGGAGLAQKKENSTGLPNNLKDGIESLSGYSMDDVTVHYNSSQPAQLNAHAFAQGSDIHVASGQEKHLPHEAWHVVQQKQGRVESTRQMKGNININDDVTLENEADVMGEKALQMKSNSINTQKKPSVQLKKESIQLRRESISNQIILGVDVYDGDVVDALISTANGVHPSASNVNWENKFISQISSTVSSKLFTPIVHNFTEYDGINMDWEVSIRFYIDHRQSTGRNENRVISSGRTGGRNSSLGHSNSSENGSEFGASVEDSNETISGSASISSSTATASSQQIGGSLGTTLSQNSNENVRRYSATIFADISVKMGANYSHGMDTINPFKWGMYMANGVGGDRSNRRKTSIGSMIFDEPRY